MSDSFKKEDREYARIAAKVKLFQRKAFDHIYKSGPELDNRLSRTQSVMPVCTHRSQMDYFIYGLFLHQCGFRHIRFAAGDNLTELPYLGPKFKSWGAFPVSRSKVMNRSYLKDLCEQVTIMTLNGNNVVVFPEGGRSYKGHMMEIRGGMLGACLVAQWRDPDHTYHFFPTAISYERLPELQYFDLLLKGKKLRSEPRTIANRIRGNLYYFGADIIAFSKLMLAKNLRRTCGSVYIDYLKPIAVNDMVNLKKHYSSRGRDDMSSLRTAIQSAGEQMHQTFLCLYRLVPSHVLAHILVSSKCSSISEAAIRVDDMVAALKQQGRNTKTLETMDARQIVDRGIELLAAFRAVHTAGDHISIRRPMVVQYHAASIAAA